MDGIRKAMNTGNGNQHESFHSKYNLFFFDLQLSFKEGAENVVVKGCVATVARV